MPTSKRRINLALPDDLQGMLESEAEAMRLPAATRVTQIIDEHFTRIAAETQRNNRVLKGSGLLAGQAALDLDLSKARLVEPRDERPAQQRRDQAE